jgi:hypothetical protein
VAALSGSRPPTKRRFHGSWKPLYAMRPFICHFLYHVCDFNLVSLQRVILQQVTPSRGRSITGAAPGHRRSPIE